MSTRNPRFSTPWLSRLRQQALAWRQGLPSQCLLCQRWPATAICDTCWQRHAPRVRRCSTCALLLPASLADTASPMCCGRCLTAPPPWQFAHAAVSYAQHWRELIARYKFHAELGLAVALAQRMAQLPALQHRLKPHPLTMPAPFDALVPIPMGPRALAARGFNAAERLAHQLAPTRVQLHLRHSPEPNAQIAPQHQLSREQRIRNRVQAFQTPAGLRLDGQRLLLVDDVMTTGATVHAATLALQRAGAAHVEVLVFARTEMPPSP